MKKALCLSLVLVMVFSLAACGGNAAPSASVSVPTPDYQPTYVPIPSSPGGSEESKAPEASADGPQYGGVVRIVEIGANGGTAEPFGFVWTPVIAKHYSTPWAEDLVNFTQAGVYEPWLATEWEVDMDERIITFHLREGVFFTDGSPFNAEAVAWNINRWEVDGRGNEEITGDPREAYAEDEYTVKVPFLNWQNVLFETFASHSYAMVSMQNFLDHDKDYAMSNPVGTGPFVLSEWVPGSHLKFVRNENYWQEGKPYLDGVEYVEMTDIMTQNAALISTGPDSMDLYQCSNAEQAYTIMTSDADMDSSYMRGSGTYVLAPNSVDPDSPFADIKVRQAVALAIDRESIVEAKGFGIMKPAYQITAEGFSGNLPASNPNLVKGYDVEAAKALMAEAGYPDGFKTMLYGPAQTADVLVIIQDQLKAIGIEAELETPEAGRLNELQVGGWEGILAFNFGQVMNTGISYYIWYHPDADTYVSVVRPPEYEEMYYTARRSFDIDNELFGALGNLILENMYLVPVYHNYSVYFVRNGLKDHGAHEYSADTMWTPWNAYWEAGHYKLS